jgi:TolB-like protein
MIRRSLAFALVLLCAGAAHARATTLMVLYFDNDTGNHEFDPLSKGLADMMITDLSSVPSLQVVERDKLEAILHELKLQRSRYFDPSTAQKIGRGAGAQYVLAGAFISVDPNMRLDVRVIRLDSGAIVKAATVTGDRKAFFDLQQKLTAQLVDGLGNVLSAGDVARAKTSATENRVDNVSAVNDYGKGLEARDAGDLSTASQLLSRVVSANPDFKLGKTRYMQIMKDLYSAKNTRANLLSDNESRLIAHIDAELARGSAASSARVLSYRVLNGKYHLHKVVDDVKAPASKWRDHLRAYVDNQQRLIAETKNVAEYEHGSGRLSHDDEKAAEELGIKQPGNTFAYPSPSAVMRSLGKLLMEGEPSIFDANVSPTERVCYYKVDGAYVKAAFDAMEGALAHIDKFERNFKARETMRTLQEYARMLADVGRQEEAIARLQQGLTQYPKSDEFDASEKLLRQILDGKRTGWRCRDPR